MSTLTKRTVSTPFGEITYELERKKVKRLNLRIRRDCTVHLSIPFRTSYTYADEFVVSNAEFIINAIDKIERKTALHTDHTYFLGKRLEIETRSSAKAGGKLSEVKEDTLILFLQTDDDEGFKKALALWQKEQGKELLSDALKKAHTRFAAAGLKVPFPELTVRSMSSRWGSCAVYKNKVTLNAVLVEKPFICMEQVACHELAHFLVQDHSSEFYRVMDKVMPEHREVYKLLNARSD